MASLSVPRWAAPVAVLADPREALPPYDAVLILCAGVDPRAAAVLQQFENRIDNQRMRAANRAVDVDGATIERAAAQLRGQTVNR